MKYRNILFGFLVGFVLVSPVLAGTQYFTGPPEVSAAIVGTNEFTPGETVNLTLAIQNKGLFNLKLTRPDRVTPDYLPNTAMLMTVGLGSDMAPLSVKSESQMIGDVPGDTTRMVPFALQINEDAPAGTYEIPVSLEYTYMWAATSEGTDNIAYYFKTDKKIQFITLVIRPMVALQVQNISAQYLSAGTEGYLNLTLRNTGSEHAREAVIHLVPNTPSNPLQPTISAIYIGEFGPSDVVQANFKIFADNSAEVDATYPFNVYCEYLDFEGKTARSDPVTIGVPVGGKIQFIIASQPPVIRPGEKKVIEIAYQNTGPESVHDAEVQIIMTSPFTGTDDTAFLGTLSHGDAGRVQFEVTLDSSATIKNYSMDSRIRYLDPLDNSHVSDTIKVPITVVASPGFFESYAIWVVVIIGIVIVAGAAYFLRTRRSRS